MEANLIRKDGVCRLLVLVAAMLLPTLNDTSFAQVDIGSRPKPGRKSAPRSAPREGPRAASIASTVSLGGGVTLDLVTIPAGSFLMGSIDVNPDERPVRRVTITKSFQVGKYEVTQRQWMAVMGTNPSTFKGVDDLPVENVSWDDCQEFIARLNAKTGKRFRLLTEAEWEYACRAGTTGDWEEDLDVTAWYALTSNASTQPVGAMLPNAWGLHDMHGNVWEWCQDRYGPYELDDRKDPIGASAGSHRVLRGGGWNGGAAVCRAAFRYGYPPGDRYPALGLRLAMNR